jgi:hypothetical protein
MVRLVEVGEQAAITTRDAFGASNIGQSIWRGHRLAKLRQVIVHRLEGGMSNAG